MKWMVLLWSCLIPFVAIAQGERPFKVMFYNTENLFDTKDDPTGADEEFTPTGLRRWSFKRYREKLTRLSKVIVAAGGETIPAVVGLCEIETDSVLFDLTRRSPLRTLGYDYVAATTHDVRGIRTALLYQPDRIKILSVHHLRVDLSRYKEARPTRDILHVAALTAEGDTLHLMVCHFPSRSGGIPQTEPYRMAAAQTLRAAIDSLLKADNSARIVAMGDFNDNPTDHSLRHGLKIHLANVSPPVDSVLYALPPFCSHPQVEGSYKFRGIWYEFDQILLSATLIPSPTRQPEVHARMSIFAPSFLLTPETTQLGLRPFSTYYGMKYQGGFSDHLPVVVNLSPRSSSP